MLRALLLSLFLSAAALASHGPKPGTFFTTRFEGGATISLFLVENGLSRQATFDFDATINVSEEDASGVVLYTDHSRHRASVRCSSPATVRVRGLDYPIDRAAPSGEDWKHALWAYLCTSSVS